MNKMEFLSELNVENAQWEALLSEIGEANMTQPEVAGGWSIKDIVAHLAGWRRRSVRRLQAALNHETSFALPWPPELQTDDEVNAWIYAANRDRALPEVLSDSREVYQQLVAVLNAFPEDALQDPSLLGLTEGEPMHGQVFFMHFHDEHEPDMRTWLAKVKRGS